MASGVAWSIRDEDLLRFEAKLRMTGPTSPPRGKAVTGAARQRGQSEATR